MRCRLWAATTLFVLLAATGPAIADIAAATSAYDRGYYATAFREWHSLAKAGDTAAQVAVAGLYRDESGRELDLTKAAHWYKIAAHAGDAVAQMNLGKMFEHGLGIKHDAIAAFVWYHRATVQSRDWAAEQRDRLIKHMTPRELTAAHQRLSKSR